MIPATLDELTPEWLTGALRGGGALAADARVIGAERGAPTGGIAVSSIVARLRVDYSPPGAGPGGVVAKLVNPEWTRGSDLYRREVRFYRELAPAHPLLTPRCYCAELDEESGAFALLLEDLGDAEPGHPLDGLDDAGAEAVIDAVAGLHRRWWESRELDAAGWPGRSYAPERAGDIAARFAENRHRLDARGIYPHTGALRRAGAAIEERLVGDLLGLGEGPRTLVHADLHAENLILLRGEGGLRVVAVDWQHAAFANPAFDLGHVLGSTRSEVLGRRWEELLARYLEQLDRPDVSLESLRARVAAALRGMFAGIVNWLVGFEPESPRDAETLQGHWERLAAAIELL